MPLPARDFDAATFGYFALRCVGRRLLGLEPALAIRFDSSFFARSNCARRVGLSPLPARLIKYVNILIPEPGPFGDILRDANARAIVLAAFVNKRACGCVESVLTFAAIEGEQTNGKKTERNDRIIAVEKDAHRFANVKSVDDLGKDFSRELEEFLVNYHRLTSKQYKVLRMAGPGQARKLVKAGMH